MKKVKLFIISVVMLIAMPALADDYPSLWGPKLAPTDECRSANAAPDLAALDVNNDGRISLSEFGDSAAADTTVSLFFSIDRNKDGYISKQELAAYRRVGKCPEMK